MVQRRGVGRRGKYKLKELIVELMVRNFTYDGLDKDVITMYELNKILDKVQIKDWKRTE